MNENVNSVLELVNPVMQRLSLFSPNTPYQPEDIKQTIRSIILRKKVEGIELMPDQNHFNSIQVDSKQYKLLVAHTCKTYVDLVFEPRFPQPKRKRIPKDQKAFSVELDGEIYQLENGDVGFSGF